MSIDDDTSDLQDRLDTEEPKTVFLQPLTASQTNLINLNVDDLLALKGRLDTEEPKIVSFQSMTAMYSGQIISK